MERKSLLPLVEQIVPIVKKARAVVKEQKREQKRMSKGIFEEGALARAEKISKNIVLQNTAENEGFEIGD